MVYAQPSTCPRKWHSWTPMGLWHTHGSPNLCQKTRPNSNQQKKKTCKIVDFAVPANHRIKLGGARGVMVIVVGNVHGDTSSNPDCISHSTNTLGKGVNPIILPPAMGK